MAYKQNAGRDNLTNLNIAALTNRGTDPETDPKKKKKVASFNNETKETSNINVTSGSPADKLSQQFGNAIDFGSQSQSTSGKEGNLTSGTNANTMASASTFGKLPGGFKGMAYDRNNKKVDFSTNNNDNRRSEDFRVY
jgi:hypothetical protein|tara:strand:- start:561 stop:974 length:414 start_codon:yes stop_codon:yes gene_type:complete